jgi:hypothetical protein
VLAPESAQPVAFDRGRQDERCFAERVPGRVALIEDSVHGSPIDPGLLAISVDVVLDARATLDERIPIAV